MAHQGIVCCTGVLGHRFWLDGFDPIKFIPNGVYLSSFFSNYPAQGGIGAIFRLPGGTPAAARARPGVRVRSDRTGAGADGTQRRLRGDCGSRRL